MAEMQPDGGSSGTIKTFLAASLFAPEDVEAFSYFQQYRDSLSATTGRDIFLGLPDAQNGIVKDLAKLFDDVGRKRFPGLQRSDLPCLWIEDEEDNHLIVHLPPERTRITDILRGVTDAAAKSKSFKEFKMEIDKVQDKVNATNTQPTQVPGWFAKAGFATVAFLIVFIAALVLIETMVKPVPTTARILVDFVMATAFAAGFAFIGGSAYAEGKIPFFQGHEPIKFATGGGVAVFVVVLGMCVWAYH